MVVARAARRVWHPSPARVQARSSPASTRLPVSSSRRAEGAAWVEGSGRAEITFVVARCRWLYESCSRLVHRRRDARCSQSCTADRVVTEQVRKLVVRGRQSWSWQCGASCAFVPAPAKRHCHKSSNAPARRAIQLRVVSAADVENRSRADSRKNNRRRRG